MPGEYPPPEYRQKRQRVSISVDEDDLQFIGELAERERFVRAALLERIIAKWVHAYKEGVDIGVIIPPVQSGRSQAAG